VDLYRFKIGGNIKKGEDLSLEEVELAGGKKAGGGDGGRVSGKAATGGGGINSGGENHRGKTFFCLSGKGGAQRDWRAKKDERGGRKEGCYLGSCGRERR